MRAKCPYCDDGCNRCEDGFFESTFSDGPIFVLECLSEDCGFANGAQILGPDLPPLRRGEIRCAMCDHMAEWSLYGWSAPEPGAAKEDDFEF